MATQAASHGPDVRHAPSASTSSSTYAPMPGSPTLTNPDMILPDYDSPDDRSVSPFSVQVWDDSASQFQLPPQNAFIAGPMTPTTPIIYGNGTMLSDIGEVTEVESVAGAPPRRASSHLSNRSEDAALRSSPTMGAPRIKRRSQMLKRERRTSLESTSTVTTQDQNAPFADFDDTVSVDDINFQGDDEESMASEYVEGTPAQQPEPVPRPSREQRLSEDSIYSTHSLSERAEQILANAKRRLNTMEGNLYRARSSLYYSPASDGSTPSPPMVKPTVPLRDPARVAGPPGHSRMLSENGLPTSSTPSTFPQRSASALGAAGGYRQPLATSRSADALGGSHAGGHKLSHHPLDTTLEPLGEDDGQSTVDNRHSGTRPSNLRSPTFGSFSEKELTRSASVAQVRDLKDQMKDLKGKISSLKEQARADSMKRRSLQSLRTPSPFTHARWDQGFMEPRRIQNVEQESNQPQTPWDYDIPAQVADAEAEADDSMPHYEPNYALKSSAEVLNGPVATEFKPPQPGDFQDEMMTGQVIPETNGSLEDRRPRYTNEDLYNDDEDAEIEDQDTNEKGQFEDAEYVQVEGEDDNQNDDDVDDYVSESGDSLYHDTFQHPVSHEDREDAFDYEHFFLHSAMGTISQQRFGRRGSSGSISSESSIETTRALKTRNRRPSMDTMSSVDTFATATEGRGSRTSLFSDDIKETVLTISEDLSDGPPTAKRSTFGGFPSNPANSSGEFKPGQKGRNTAGHRTTSSTSQVSNMKRPSISSFESTGTNRSFPLVNKAKLNGGVLTPGGTPNGTPGGSPDHELRQISRSLLHDTADACDKEIDRSASQTPAMQMLHKEDQALVERMVASLGKCVLGLSEASRASSEARAYRRRLEAARRILEGLDD